jgi:hypothetical protein
MALPDDLDKATFRICRDLAILERVLSWPLFFLSYNQLALRLDCHDQESFRIMRRLRDYRIIELVENGTKRALGIKPKASTWKWMLEKGSK